MKKTIRLTESGLHKVIEESVKRILIESDFASARDAFINAYNNNQEDVNDFYNTFRERSRDNFDPNMPVVLVGGRQQGEYTAQEIVDNFEVTGYKEPSTNATYANSKIIGYPKIKGYLGPMWDGDRIRYETQEVYNGLSI